MSDSAPPPPPSDPSGPGHQPNWGSAYPPPPAPGGYPPPPGYGYPQYVAPPKHPRATTAMVLGIVSVAGGLMCYLPLLLAPYAWFTGTKAVRDIDESRGALGGRGEATSGKVLGIIGTVILGIGLALLIVFVILLLTVDSFWNDFTEGWEEA
jgi:hypothetical protein